MAGISEICFPFILNVRINTEGAEANNLPIVLIAFFAPVSHFPFYMTLWNTAKDAHTETKQLIDWIDKMTEMAKLEETEMKFSIN